MMKSLVILLITISAVNCGLLKELIQPVTDNVHKGELFNQKEQKEDAKESKGVLDKLVNKLDAGAEKLVDVLTGDFKLNGTKNNDSKTDIGKTEKPEVKTDKPDASKVPSVNETETGDVKKQPEVKDLDNVSTTLPTDKDNEVKVEEVTTPKVDEVKPEDVAKKVEEAKAEEPKA